MAGKQVSGAGLPESIAGMSKNQLYDIMSQMKVLPFSFFLLAVRINVGPPPFFRFLNSVFVFEQCLDVGGMISVVFIIMQTLIEQNQQQAKQILIQNPLLTKALFQVSIFRFFVY